MSLFDDVINRKRKEWNCEDLMDATSKNKEGKIPFSSILLNWSTYGGIPRNRITEFFGEPGGGKAQPLDSNILTPSGWVQMKDIRVGDTIFDGSGKLCKVDGVYPQGVRPIYKITFQDRESIKVADNHLNVVWRRNSNKAAREDFCVETTELIKLMSAPDYRCHSKFRVDLPEVDWPYQEVKIDPYLLGVLIGDGSLKGNLTITNCEKDIIDRVDDILRRDFDCHLVQDSTGINYSIQLIDPWYPNTYIFKDKEFKRFDDLLNFLESEGFPRIDTYTLYGCVSGKATYTLDKFPELANLKVVKNPPSGRNRLVSALESYGLICTSLEKHIPKAYLFNSREVRIALLQGLYDTDGYTSKYNPEHDTNGASSEFTTSSEQLSKDFAFLVRSLGIRDTIVCNLGKYINNGQVITCHNSYTHYIKVPNNLQFYTSKKHSNRYRLRQNSPIRNIIDIEYIGDEECQCIHVDSNDHTYITDNFTPTHNTTTAVDICKNSIEIFKSEHETKIQELRRKAASGNKSAAAEIEDLIESGPKRVLYIDLEHSFDGTWAKTLGIDTTKISIMQPPDVVAEDVLQAIQELVETGEVGLIVLDSLPSLVPKTELEKKFGERTVAALAGLLTVFCRKIVPLLTRYECTLIFINQIRENMDNPYVVKTPGGTAPRFYASLRMLFKVGSPVDFLGNEVPQSTENPAGYIINTKIVKQKSAPFDRKNASYYLMCQSGIRTDMDLAQLAIKRYGLIKKSAGWFTIISPDTGEVLEVEGKPVKINGLSKVYEYLQSHPDYYRALNDYISSDIFGKSDECESCEESL